MDKRSANASRVSLEKQLTKSAQGLMISYQSLARQEDNLKKQEALYHTLYENTQTSLQAGLATAQDVSTAYNNWLGAQVSLSSASDSVDSVYKSLCMLTGMDENGSTAIAEVPEADTTRITEVDLEADMEQAISNNTSIISTRTDTSDASTAGMANKNRNEEENIAQAKIKFKELYEQLLQAYTSYKAAKTGLSGAEIIWNNAQSKYSMGMFSQAEYLQAQIQYLQKKLAFETSDLTLQQAQQTYDWAVKGQMSIN